MSLNLEDLVLQKGSHEDREHGMCVMEAVAFVAGEPHSDHPRCASEVLTSFCMRFNDVADDATRQRLKPFVPRLVGTRTTPEDDETRAWMATDWLVRVATPTWLRAAGMEDKAAMLESLGVLNAFLADGGADPVAPGV